MDQMTMSEIYDETLALFDALEAAAVDGVEDKDEFQELREAVIAMKAARMDAQGGVN